MIRASKQSKSIAVVAGGDLYAGAIAEIRRHGVVIGVDGGAWWLIRNGIVPDIAIGDFDSVSEAEKRRIHDESRIYMEFPPEKDATDLELALEEVIRRLPERAVLYGVLGGRFDHALTAIQLLGRLESHNIYGEIVDNFNKITIVRRKQQKFSRDGGFRYLSVVPLDSGVVVTLSGFRYDVEKRAFPRNGSLGISNEFRLARATVTVHSGSVAVIRSRDRVRR